MRARGQENAKSLWDGRQDRGFVARWVVSVGRLSTPHPWLCHQRAQESPFGLAILAASPFRFSKLGNPCKVRYRSQVVDPSTRAGQAYRLSGDLKVK